MRSRFFWWGLCGALALLIFFLIGIAAKFALAYDGTCGGLMPFLAGPKPCSLLQYIAESTLLTVVILGRSYWPVVLALLMIPAFTGYIIDRRMNS